MNDNRASHPTIYHFEASRGFRVVWLCEELGIDYNLVFKPGDQMGSLMDIRAIHPPMPIAPLLGLDGEIIVESGAIIDILLARYANGRLVPPVNSIDFLFHSQWMHFAEGTGMARMTQTRFAAMQGGIDVDQMPEGYRAGGGTGNFLPIGPAAVFDFIESHLEKHKYFGGSSFSAADIMMEYVVRVAKLVIWKDTRAYSRIAAWRDEMEARAAYQRAVKCSTFGDLDDVGVPLHCPHPFARPSQTEPS
jgi:glutathione S-transferase